MSTDFTFHAMGEPVAVGTNPEAADYDNPRGTVYSFAAYVLAEDTLGNRTRLHVATGYAADVLATAEKLAVALNARLAKHGKLPVGFSSWEHFYPAYGSFAHSEADLIEWEERIERESEFS